MRRASVGLACLAAISFLIAAEPPDGARPLGADGKPLNLDFETGDLRDWTPEGDAFVGQPIAGDTVAGRRRDMKSDHQGKYWIGGWERKGDAAQGTLTSVPFRVTQPWCSFLVGGGPYETTCVELVRKDTGTVVSRTSGIAEENLRRVAVDLGAHQGKEIFIRLVDRHTGHWGHVNFDDFRLHAARPDVPARPPVREPALAMPADQYKFAGLSPEKAAAAMTVPEGFTVTLAAGEPDVRQPIAFAIDDRGRLWVAEAYNYPLRKPFPGPVLPAGEPGDRIVIFEDTTGSGKLDKRTVFMEGLNLVSGIELGFGGVWIGAAPYLLFIPVDATGDKPAGPPQILLDGWAYEDTHETLNTFTWGPDGWLYGCHGVFTHSRVGKPGTPDRDRVPINAGIWRYHPTRHVFEVFAHGTSNPWGLDFNEHGELFIEACVIPHLYHMVPGGRYERQAGAHFNPYTYADIQTIADHRHYLGNNPHAGNNRSDEAGGGHAHCGLMCYLGGAWPEQYRGKLFMGNVHGRRINVDSLKPKGSSYVASHTPDFLLANDAWARFINMKYGPDGNAWLIDWYDQQACHDNKVQIWDRTNGRIYKISYRGTKPVIGLDLAKCTDEQLVEYQKHPNEWYARQSRRILQERYVSTGGTRVRNKVTDSIARLALESPDELLRLRALWSFCVLDSVAEPDVLSGALKDKSERIRAWAVRIGCDREPQDTWREMLSMSANDPSALVRRSIAAGLQEVPTSEAIRREIRPTPESPMPTERWPGLINLANHAEDAADPIIPHLVWYALEPLAEVDSARALALAAGAKLPNLMPNMVRRIAAIGTPEALELLAKRLVTDKPGREEAFLAGLTESLKGRRQVAMPPSWPEAFAKLQKHGDSSIRDRALALGLKFGDPAARAALRGTLSDPAAVRAKRQAALAALVESRDPELAPMLHKLIAEPSLAGAALRALALYDNADTPGVILRAYAALGPNEKRDALSTLAARPAYAKALVAAIKAKQLPTGDVSAAVVRQLRALRNPALDAAVTEIWGVIRNATPAERTQLIAEWKKKLSTPTRSPIDLSAGRAVFAKTCASCHVLFGEGGQVGPDITGANRASLDYLLENTLDPSAVIAKEYTATRLDLTKGTTIICIVKSETANALTVVTDRETLTIPKSDIAARESSDSSMMPEDLLKPLSEDEIRALFAYLQSTKQVPLPKGFATGK